jgi:hypothetical protein
MPILPKAPKQSARLRTAVPQDDGWRALAWVGTAFVIMGLTDIALGWYPASFGNAEWEFGAISASLNGFALPTLGLYLILGSTVALERGTLGRVLSIVLLVLAFVIGALAVTYVTVVPMALQSVATEPALTAGMRKAIIKASVLFVAYGALFAMGARRAWRTGKA